MEIIKCLTKKIVNIVMWIWSHFPVICLSDDDNYATLEIDKIRGAHLRISLLNFMFGDTIVYVLSYDIKERKFYIMSLLQLRHIDGNFLDDHKINDIQENFRIHISGLTDSDLEVEKEKLLYHIEREEQRIDTSTNKINIYAMIVLTTIPIVMTLIDFGSIKKLHTVLLVMVWFEIYGLFNIVIFIFRTIKISGINKSKFSDLKKSKDRKKEIIVQYQYDWEQLQYKANLIVSFVLNLQEWLVFTLVLTIIIFFGSSLHNHKIVQTPMQDIKSSVFTVNEKEINIPYSDSSVDWQTVLLDIEKDRCKYLIILINGNEVPKVINELKKYNGLETEIIIDCKLEKDEIKLVEVK